MNFPAVMLKLLIATSLTYSCHALSGKGTRYHEPQPLEVYGKESSSKKPVQSATKKQQDSASLPKPVPKTADVAPLWPVEQPTSGNAELIEKNKPFDQQIKDPEKLQKVIVYIKDLHFQKKNNNSESLMDIEKRIREESVLHGLETPSLTLQDAVRKLGRYDTRPEDLAGLRPIDLKAAQLWKGLQDGSIKVAKFEPRIIDHMVETLAKKRDANELTGFDFTLIAALKAEGKLPNGFESVLKRIENAQEFADKPFAEVAQQFSNNAEDFFRLQKDIEQAPELFLWIDEKKAKKIDQDKQTKPTVKERVVELKERALDRSASYRDMEGLPVQVPEQPVQSAPKKVLAVRPPEAKATKRQEISAALSALKKQAFDAIDSLLDAVRKKFTGDTTDAAVGYAKNEAEKTKQDIVEQESDTINNASEEASLKGLGQHFKQFIQYKLAALKKKLNV